MLLISKQLELKIMNIYLNANLFNHTVGALKNCLNEVVLLSTHNVCFDRKIRIKF